MRPAPTSNQVARGSALARLARPELILPGLALAALALIASPHVTRAGDDRLESLAQQTARLESLIARYNAAAVERSPTTHPAARATRADLFHRGWADLIDAGFLERAPINPITGSSAVTRQASAASGWRYDEATGELQACVIDPDTGETRLLAR